MSAGLIIGVVIMLLFFGVIIGVMIYAIKKSDPKNVDTSLNEKNETTQEMLPFEDIRDSMIHLGNHQYRAVLCCTSVNYGLKTEQEQDVIELAFQRFLNSLSFPISIFVQTRTMDNEKMLESLRTDTLEAIDDFPILENYGEAYFEEMSEIYDRIGNNKERRKYIIIPYNDAINLTTATDNEKYKYSIQEMQNRLLVAIDGLESIGITARLLNTPDLIDLLYVTYHKDSANHSDNLNHHEFLDMIVSGDNKLNDLSDEARLDWILYEAQLRLQTEISKVNDVDSNIVKRAEVGIKNINIIRKKIAGYYQDKTFIRERD